VSIDLNSTSSGFQIVRETFKVQAPERRPQFSESTRRFGGAYQTSETHGNGAVGASFYINGASADAAIVLWEKLLSTLEDYDSTDYYLKWKPEGTSINNFVFYQIRGSASWEAQYRPLEFSQNKTLVFDVSWPVAPLARGAATTFSQSSQTYPDNKVQLSVGGTAPALLDLSVAQTSLGSDFFMVGWTQRPSSYTPQTNVVAPFGLIDTYNGGYISTTNYTTATGGTPAANRISIAASPGPTIGTTYNLDVSIDPSVLQRDDFTRNEIQLEVWGRMYVNTAHKATVVTSLEPSSAATGASSRYTSEYGSTGKLLAAPSSGSGWYYYRLGTLPASVDSNNAAVYKLRLSTTFTASVAAEFAIDHIAIVPARQRALTPTGRALDSSYPRFVNSASAVTKTIRNDLSGWLGTTPYPDSGLGGQLLEVPPGNVDLFIKATRGVPDITTTADDATQTLTVSGTIIPRYYLARGS
jgi:hypothetical protein